MSGTKGVAVSQIILLVLGILVLAVVAYLLYTQFVSSNQTIGAETCRAEATRVCTGCIISAGGALTENCKYTNNKNLDLCYDNSKMLGSGSKGSVDCKPYTGGNVVSGGSGTGGTSSVTGNTCTDIDPVTPGIQCSS